MTAYLYQDMIFALAGFFLAGLLVGYSVFKRPTYLLLGLTMLLSTAGLTDVIFRYNTDATVLMLADSANVVCGAFGLTIFLHYSLIYLLRANFRLFCKDYILLYFPAVALAIAYAFTPLMVGGITAGAAGFHLTYNPGYWLVIIFGAAYLLLIGLINLYLLIESADVKERERAAVVLFVVGLYIYYYCSVLAFPFLFKTPNFSSPLPLTLATLVLVYTNFKYCYFTDQMEPGCSNEPKKNAKP